MVKVVYKKHQEEIESFPPNMLKVFLRQKILDIVVTFLNLSSSLFFLWQICIMTHTHILVLEAGGGDCVRGSTKAFLSLPFLLLS